MKIFFLLNPSLKKKQWDYRELGARVSKRYGWQPRFGEVDRHHNASTENLLRQAREEGCGRVVVIGGDGTLHRVVNVLYRQKRLNDMEVALVPAGTCNDFGRFLGLRRKRLEDAFRVACTGAVQAVDLGLMGDEVFINNAGFGRRRTASPTPAKPLKTLRSFRPVTLQARWEKGSIEGEFYMALACNAPYFSGGLYFSKNTQISDGLLDVYFIPAIRKWKLVPLLLLGRLGRPVSPRQMISLRVHRLTLQAQSDLWPQADGEPAEKPVRTLEFSVAAEKAMIVIRS